VSAAVDDRNPLGVKLTQKQLDESERESYRYHAVEYGLDYYIAGRFSIAHRSMSVGASILHHAVEMLLKACLAKDDPIETIREYGYRERYGHNLSRLWQEFRARNRLPLSTEFDATIQGLHEFEAIRYPDKMIREGAQIRMDIFDVDNPPSTNAQMPEKLYALKLPQVDRLMGLLFPASGMNPLIFLPRFENDKLSMIYYDMVRQTLFGRSKPPLPKSKPWIDWAWWLFLFAVIVVVIAAQTVQT
jgi:hypothetical protein